MPPAVDDVADAGANSKSVSIALFSTSRRCCCCSLLLLLPAARCCCPLLLHAHAVQCCCTLMLLLIVHHGFMGLQDTFGKLSLFSLLMEKVDEVKRHSLLVDATCTEQPDWAKLIDGYTEELQADRAGCAVMLGHVHDRRPETATRNMGDVAELLLREPAKFKGVKFLVIEMDGGHGAREGLTIFALGILWRVRNLDVLAEGEGEGGWSKLGNVEKVNGAGARAINGAPLLIDSPDASKLISEAYVNCALELGAHSEPVVETLALPCVSTAFAARTLPLPCVSTASVARTLPLPRVSTASMAKTPPLCDTFLGVDVPMELRKIPQLRKCLQELVDRVDGAVCSIGDKHIDGHVAREDEGSLEKLINEYGLDFDHDEIKSFWTCKEKDAFVGRTVEATMIYKEVTSASTSSPICQVSSAISTVRLRLSSRDLSIRERLQLHENTDQFAEMFAVAQVWRCYNLTGDEACMRRTAHSCTWRKPANFIRPREMHESFHNLLDAFGGWPPLPVPSHERPPTLDGDESTWTSGSYMSFPERLRTAKAARENNDNDNDKFYSEKMFKEFDKQHQLVERICAGEEISTNGMRKLVDALRNSPLFIRDAFAVATTRRKYDKVLIRPPLHRPPLHRPPLHRPPLHRPS